jgi:iron complex outermembrane receptor protein
MKKSVIARACALSLLCNVAFAQTQPQNQTQPQEVIVTATRAEFKESEAPYATEVYTREDIKRSGASTLYEFLAKQTSLQVLPSYGNRDTPSINARGYGIENGHQNIAISVNGRKLNSIDQANPLLGAISVQEIEQIEITMGTGGVLYGDGATAGSIQIITKPLDGAAAEAYVGSNNSSGVSTRVGTTSNGFSLSASADNAKSAGASQPDSTGNRDKSNKDNWRIEAGLRSDGGVKLGAYVGSTTIDARYAEPMTLVQWQQDPSQNPSRIYGHQQYVSELWGMDASIPLTSSVRLIAKMSDEHKRSQDLKWSTLADYKNQANEVSLQYANSGTHVSLGHQQTQGQRYSPEGWSPANLTSKNSSAWFGQVNQKWDRLALMFGARQESVTYDFKPATGDFLNQKNKLSFREVGANFAQSNALNFFGTFSKSAQAPDIDRFFVTDFNPFPTVTSFNGFVQPAKANTLTAGLTHKTEQNKFKLSVFRANLQNEIYLYNGTTNTNIDQSHKYGLSLQDSLTISPKFNLWMNYTYTKAVIDHENDGAGKYDGKNLPGVSRNSLVIGLGFKPTEKIKLNLSQTWRSKAYALNDFENNFTQRQLAYKSTDLMAQYEIQKRTEVYVAVSNLLNHSNGLWVKDNGIYPFDFSRTYKVGLRVAF